MGKKVEVKTWWKNLPAYVKGIAAVISALGVIWGCLTSMVNAISQNLNDRIDSKVNDISNRIENIELDTQRLQLLHLMDSGNASVKSVLDVAERYFCVLKGDSYVLYEFQEWASKNNVDANFVLKCHKATYAEQ